MLLFRAIWRTKHVTIAMSDGGNAKYPFMGCTVLQFWVESYRLLVGQSLARPDRGTVHTVAVGPSGHPPLVPPMQKPGPYCHFGELAAGRGQEPVGVVGTSWGRCRGRQSVSQSDGGCHTASPKADGTFQGCCWWGLLVSSSLKYSCKALHPCLQHSCWISGMSTP